MTDNERSFSSIRSMHEWPLVIFTATVVPAAGMYASTLVADFVGMAFVVPLYLRGLAAALLAGGLLFSLLHLGRPLRAPRALVRAGRNWLSTEVAFAATLVVLALALLVPSVWQASGPGLRRLAGAAGAVLLVALGLVYFLRSHSRWRSPLVAGPLLTGVASGSVVLAVTPGNREVVPLALAMIAADAVLCIVAWRTGSGRALSAHPAVNEYRRRLLALRLVFTNVLPAGLLLAGFRPSAAIAIGIGVLLDRFNFYGLATVESTEACVAEVERRIERASGVA